MGHLEKKHNLPYSLIILTIFFYLSSSCCFSINDGDNLFNYGYLQEEFGYDFRAFPSSFSPIEGVKLENNSTSNMRAQVGLSDFKKLRKLASSVKTVDVLSFGAEGDGITDDTKAFQNAWNEACSSSADFINLVVPKSRSYLLKPLRFSGPCKSDITMQISGTMIASDDLSDYIEDERHWLIFDRVQNLAVEGGGTIDGNGNIWWQNSCKIDKSKPCKSAPTVWSLPSTIGRVMTLINCNIALTFYKCTNLVVKNLKIQNAQKMHVSFERCTNVEASNLMVTAPEKSPNTDGIHVTATQNIQISSCTIGTGDDCISIESGSQKVRATGITCGPGHGISIGSLGDANSEAYVSDVVVNGAKLSGTTNGVRIKTWQGGSGTASNIKFQNIQMENVKNPIIIDQNYCDQDDPCTEQESAVQVKNVVYQNVKGTSSTDVAINFNCSKTYPCQGILLQNVNLKGDDGEQAKAVCNNVDLVNWGDISPRCTN